jgi:hypothetical protein
MLLELQLQRDLYNKICRIKHKLYIASGKAPTLMEKFWMRTWVGKT